MLTRNLYERLEQLPHRFARYHGRRIPIRTNHAAREILGTVIVKDTGFSRFNYKTAVATAAEKIVRIGGNGLHIDYFRKSGFLPSGLLEGQMLRFADSLYKDLLADSLCSACTVPESRLAKSSTEKPMPKHSFYANAAYAFILSKFMAPAGATGDASRGFEFNAGYNYTPKKPGDTAADMPASPPPSICMKGTGHTKTGLRSNTLPPKRPSVRSGHAGRSMRPSASAMRVIRKKSAT